VNTAELFIAPMALGAAVLRLMLVRRARRQPSKPTRQLAVREQIIKPDSNLPDWRQGERDENGNRYYMLNFNGEFAKWVEHEPAWGPEFGRLLKECGWPPERLFRLFQKVHPLFYLDENGYGSPGIDCFDRFIYPERPPRKLLEEVVARDVARSSYHRAFLRKTFGRSHGEGRGPPSRRTIALSSTGG
jgi:hypothetical protein